MSALAVYKSDTLDQKSLRVPEILVFNRNVQDNFGICWDPCMYSFVFVFELIDYHQIIDWLKNVTGNTKTITKNNKHTHNM